MIYFIQAGTDGPIKIGYVKGDIRKRLSQLQTSNPEELKCIGYMEGGRYEENRTHARFESAHLRGEWFSPTDELLLHIRNCAPLNDITLYDYNDNKYPYLLNFSKDQMDKLRRRAKIRGVPMSHIVREAVDVLFLIMRSPDIVRSLSPSLTNDRVDSAVKLARDYTNRFFDTPPPELFNVVLQNQ